MGDPWDFGSFGRRWSMGRRQMTMTELFVLLTVVGVYYGLVSFVHWLEGLSATAQRVLFALGLLALVGAALGLGIRSLVQRAASRAAEGPTSDVVALRFALDAAVAPRIARELGEALKAPRAARLGQVATCLLGAQSEWRFVSLLTTPPLPEAQAAALFDFWSEDARKRFTAPDAKAEASPYREPPLLVISLNLETQEEIPDLREDDPVSVARTLHLLKNKPRTVRRVDLWSSAQPVPAARLRELDPRMIEPAPWT
jgi:hypothetical protein